MKNKIYTRTGDKGETSLFTGQRVPKNDPFIVAIGSVDECNSAIGSAISLLPKEDHFSEIINQLETIQHALFDLGAAVATPRSRADNSKIEKTRFDGEETALIESWIDSMMTELPKLNTFILPGGHPSGAMLHLARSICRRAEREVVPLTDHADVSENVFVYLNRLSDYLFILSRMVNHLTKTPETLWVHNKLTAGQS
ncbi:MAG: cob(I)yrinic acid a,c-diamide adenosyltransferase [Chlamydiota bacterium]|nr:cob(I)yrinic acid a,c-diamide adenosyltransferase [Chlamydiota bacterium]